MREDEDMWKPMKPECDSFLVVHLVNWYLNVPGVKRYLSFILALSHNSGRQLRDTSPILAHVVWRRLTQNHPHTEQTLY